MGPEALSVVDQPRVASWLGRALGVPEELIRSISSPETKGDEIVDALIDGLSDIAGSVDQTSIAQDAILSSDAHNTLFSE
jgi:hypothetical protein